MLAREEEGQTTIAVTTLLAVETRGNYDELHGIIISVKVYRPILYRKLFLQPTKTT